MKSIKISVSKAPDKRPIEITLRGLYKQTLKRQQRKNQYCSDENIISEFDSPVFNQDSPLYPVIHLNGKNRINGKKIKEFSTIK